jgi:hypothetical protein
MFGLLQFSDNQIRIPCLKCSIRPYTDGKLDSKIQSHWILCWSVRLLQHDTSLHVSMSQCAAVENEQFENLVASMYGYARRAEGSQCFEF